MDVCSIQGALQLGDERSLTRLSRRCGTREWRFSRAISMRSSALSARNGRLNVRVCPKGPAGLQLKNMRPLRLRASGHRAARDAKQRQKHQGSPVDRRGNSRRDPSAIDGVLQEKRPLNFELAHERSIAQRLAMHMEPHFCHEWDIDCPYDRDGQLKRKRLRASKAATRKKKRNEILPDIIVHHREAEGRAHNLLVIELKKAQGRSMR